MCLDLPDLERRTLGQGVHSGYQWQIVHNDMGFRCGYVRVEPGHPWFGKDYDEIDVSVHGGLTFAEHGKACATHDEKAEWWVGFDCGHSGDGPDHGLPHRHPFPHFDGDVVRDQEYVVAECESLAQQAAEAIAV